MYATTSISNKYKYDIINILYIVYSSRVPMAYNNISTTNVSMAIRFVSSIRGSLEYNATCIYSTCIYLTSKCTRIRMRYYEVLMYVPLTVLLMQIIS